MHNNKFLCISLKMKLNSQIHEESTKENHDREVFDTVVKDAHKLSQLSPLFSL